MPWRSQDVRDHRNVEWEICNVKAGTKEIRPGRRAAYATVIQPIGGGGVVRPEKPYVRDVPLTETQRRRSMQTARGLLIHHAGVVLKLG